MERSYLAREWERKMEWNRRAEIRTTFMFPRTHTLVLYNVHCTHYTDTNWDTGERTQQSNCEHVHDYTECRRWNEGIRHTAQMSCAHVRLFTIEPFGNHRFAIVIFCPLKIHHNRAIRLHSSSCFLKRASRMRIHKSIMKQEVHKRRQLHNVAPHHSTAWSAHIVFWWPLVCTLYGCVCVCVMSNAKNMQNFHEKKNANNH